MVEKYWKKFENSGKIEDYLAFVSSTRQEQADMRSQVEKGNHAGIYTSNGNYTEANSDRGIRQTYQPFD